MTLILQLTGLFLLGIVAGPAFAQLAVVAHTSATSSPSSPINTTGANFTAVCTQNLNGGVAPTDSSGNSYKRAFSYSNSGYITTELWVSFHPVTSPAETFSAGGSRFTATAYSGVASGPDQANGSITSLSTGRITPSNANELILSCAGIDVNAGAVASVTPLTLLDSSPYTPGTIIADGYQIQTTPTAVGATWSSTQYAGSSFAVGIASFYSTQSPAPLAVATTSLAEGFRNAGYGNQLAATGGVQPYTWTLASGTLPLGVTLTSSGLISGSPILAVLATPLTFEVTDAQSHTAFTSGLTLTVAGNPLSIATSSCPTGTQYQTYAGCAIGATGGTAPLTYSWCGNPPWTAGPTCNNQYQALPEGLSINPTTGAISGTVHGMGQYNVQMTVTDAAGAVAKQVIGFEIAGSNSAGSCIFPADSIYYQNVSALPVDTSPLAPIYSAYITASINPGFGDITYGIPYMVVPSTQPMVPMVSNAGGQLKQAPFPFDAPMEGTRNSPPNPPLSNYNGDNHVLVQQLSGNGVTCGEWDTYQVYPNYPNTGNNSWGDGTQDGQPGQYSAHWDMSGYTLLPLDQGGVDAAGLPVIPFLEDANEVIGTGTPSAPNGVIHEPKRFTVQHTAQKFVWPATASAGNGSGCIGGFSQVGSNLASQLQPPTSCTGITGPMGEIYRLKASVATPACAATSPQSAIIIQGFRNYGIILADNGGNGAVIGTNDSRWNNADLQCLKGLKLSDFEPVEVEQLAKSWPHSAQVISNGTTGTTGGGTTGTGTGTAGGTTPVGITGSISLSGKVLVQQ